MADSPELRELAEDVAVMEEAGRRLAEIMLGNLEDWAPIGLVPEAFKAPPVRIEVTWTPACRLCGSLGYLGCPVHGPFPLRFPDPALPWLRGW